MTLMVKQQGKKRSAPRISFHLFNAMVS
jgi:hypothetical protein